LFWTLKAADHFENLGVVQMVILKWILEKKDVKLWAENYCFGNKL
jgi:hypothetical protein